jgi:hypothetical protein
LRTLGSRFILAAGQEYDSRVLKHRFGRGMRKACYRNAFELALKHPGELTYCEGRALSCGIVPIEHAWCVTPEGRVVDTTWRDDERHYFGVKFDTDWLIGWIESRSRYGVLADLFPKELLEMDPAVFLAQPGAEQVERTRALQSEVLAALKRSS